MTKSQLLRAFALAAALVLSACASNGSRPEPVMSQEVAPPPPFPEDVEGRAQVRWDLLVAKAAARGYDLLAPGYRTSISREKYEAAFTHRPVTWLGAKVTGKKCDGDSCTVMVEVRYKAEIPQSSAGPIESVAYLEERWIRTDGAWFLVPEKASGGELR